MLITNVTVTHWLPIITRCPLSIFPDFVYVEVDYVVGSPANYFPELYNIRKRIRKTIKGKRAYMEDLAAMLANEFPEAVAVKVRLPFNRHFVQVTNKDY